MDHRQLDTLVYTLVEVFTNKTYEYDEEIDDTVELRLDRKEIVNQLKEQIELAGIKHSMANSILEYVVFNSQILINKKKRVVLKSKVSDIKFAIRAVLRMYHLLGD